MGLPVILHVLIEFMKEFAGFLLEWPQHIPMILFVLVEVGIILFDLLVPKHGHPHATIGANGAHDNACIGCGDMRVWRLLALFGGPAGLTYGIPYFLLMGLFPKGSLPYEYLAGFVYAQFLASIAMTLVLFFYALFFVRNWMETVVLFKSHLKGCGWITALGPFWFLYFIQKISWMKWLWVIRDIESIVLYLVTLPITMPLCFFATLLSGKIIVPAITWIDQEHNGNQPHMSKHGFQTT